MIANLAKALQSALKSIPSSVFDTETEAYLNQHWALGSRVLLAFQTLAERQSTSLLSPLEQLETVIDVIAKTFDFPLAFIEQHNAAAETLEIVAAFGIAPSTQHKPIPLAQQTLSGMAITTQAPTVWSEARDPVTIPQLKDIELFADRFCTVVIIPLLYEQETVGVLTLAHPDCQPVEKYVIHWLSSVAASVASTLAYVQLAQRQSQVQERLDLAALGLRGIIYDLDLEQRQMLRTRGIVNLLGYDESEVVPSLAWWLNRVHPEDRPELEIFLAQEAQNHREFALTYRVRRINDQYLTVCDRGVVMRDASGDPIRLIGTITEQTYGLEQLQSDSSGSTSTAFLNRQDENIQDVSVAAPLPLPPQPHTTSVPPLLHPSTILDRLQDVIFQTDRDGKWTFLNLAWSTLTGFSVEETLGQRWQDFIHPDDVLAQAEAFVSVLNQESAAIAELNIQSPHPESIAIYPQLRYITKAGETRWVEVHCQPLWGVDRSVIGTTGTLYDITNRKSTEVQLLHDAMHDSLTGLPTRVLFADRLQHAYQNYQRYPETGFAILFLDLDRFKVVNDSLGHIVGDQLLAAVAERLNDCLRPGDTVARFGGDEFTVLLPNVLEVKDAIQVSERILSQMSQPFNLSEHKIYTSASIGIALSSGPEQRPDELLRNADIALYRAKANGKGRYDLFSPTMYADARAQLELETELRRAIEQQELTLHYQPIHGLPDRQLVGVEALLFWNHPQRGLLALPEFLPLAEETGLIASIGWWALKSACKQLQTWRQRYASTAESLFMCVTLFAPQLEAEEFEQRVHQILTHLTLPSHCLMLQVNERLFAENIETATAKLQPLRNLGIYLCLDAFGRRFSAFGDLSHLPISHLRIHRSFISEMKVGKNLEAVASMLDMGSQLGLRVIAEGIETEPQIAQLQAMKCDYGQGLFLSPVLPPDDLLNWFDQPVLAAVPSMIASSVPFPTLVVYVSPRKTQVPLREGKSWSMGRSLDSTVVLSDRWVSRNHAEIQLLDNGSYYLVDLGSGNGSFVNGQRVVLPVCLNHGDLLTIGRTEMEFQFSIPEMTTQLQEKLPLQQIASETSDPSPKTVLLMQASGRQGNIWRAALKSQGITLINLNSDIDLQQMIEQRVQSRRSLPDLLLVDMTILRPNPYSFCRWCHSEYPQLKIVLTSGTRIDVPPSERQWAIHQGAVDLMAAFPEENLFSKLVDIAAKVRSLLQILDMPPVSQQSLASTLMSIQSVVSSQDTLLGFEAFMSDD